MTMTTIKRIINISTLTLALAAITVAGCSAPEDGAQTTEDNTPTRRSVRVETLTLQPTTFEDIIELTGTVESLNDATLSAQSSGTVEYVAELGQTVSQGAVVARLDKGIAEAALSQATAQVEAAQAQLEWEEYNFARQERLAADSVISSLELQTAQTQFNRAKAQLRQSEAMQTQAEEQLKNTTVTAPFSGTIETRFVEPGEQISPGQPVVRVVNTQRVKVTVGVPERYAADVEVGTSVALDFKAYRGQQQRGTVTFAGSAINPDSRTFPIEIEVRNNDRRLKPQMIAEVYVTRNALDEVIVVPRSAVIRDEEGTSVFVVTNESGVPTATRKLIALGPAYGGRVTIDSGVAAGDEVVVLGQTGVTDGDAVNVVEQYTMLNEQGVPVKTATPDTDVVPASL